MIQTDIDNITSNKKKYFSFELQTNIDKADIINHTISDSDISNTNDDNIDWDFVSKQLEIKLQTSSDIIQSQNSHTKLPKQYGFTVIQQISQDDENIIIHPTSPVQKQNIITNRFNNHHSNILHELLNELNACQQKQADLIKQIQILIKQSKQISFFLPLNSLNNNNNNSKTLPSLQDAFQQKKSLFIEQSKERVKQIYSHKNKFHHRIIPNIKQTNNTYLQEKRKYENDRLCAMIIKHQNRQNAKIYGNLIKNQLCHN